MAENNGQQNNLSRLDRIEAALEVFIGDHETFGEEHKKLLRSQVILQDAQTRAEAQNKATRENLDALINMVDRDHREFHERHKRPEEKQ